MQAYAAAIRQGKSREELAAARDELFGRSAIRRSVPAFEGPKHVPATDELRPSALPNIEKEKPEQAQPELAQRARQSAEQWRQWIEKNVGGPPGRVEAAVRAAMNSLSRGRNGREVATAALIAAGLWKETGGSPSLGETVAMTPEPPREAVPGTAHSLQARQEIAMQQWQEWIKKNIGGPEDRVAAATKVAMDSFSQGRNSSEIAADARKAASLWEERGSLDSDRAAARPMPMMPKMARGVIVGTVRSFQTRQESARGI
jgi:hypothetical protein